MRFAAVLLVAARMVYGDAGVLIPGGHDVPDAGVFALQEMSIDIFVDNGTARVRMREIFANQTDRVQEGEYHFALPSGAAVSDFAVWDDVTRIPGVILERKRAGELYEQIKAQSIDPGLLEMGERGADEARRNAMFTAKIVPVPAHGTKRIEIEYQEPVGVDGLRSVLAVPIHPDVYSAITAGQLTASITVQSAHAIQDFAGIGKAYRLQIREKNANAIRADFSGANVALTEDFAFGFAYAASDTDMLRVITEREEGDGFFGARALLSQPVLADKAAGRTVIALFDTSLSMQWDKLERSFAACETLLKRLRPEDSFNLLLFNGNVAAWSTAPKPATPANVEGALAFIRASKIRGGTDIEKAVDAAVAQTREASGESYIVLISDGGANEGTVNNARLAEHVGARLRAIAETRRPHLFTFAVGDDANLPLMRSLAVNNGVAEWVRSTEPIEFKLNAFLSKIGQQPIKGLTLSAQPPSNLDLIYELEPVHFAGSAATWVGQYRQPLAKASFAVSSVQARMQATTALPAQETDHPELPRLWAKARVDALLAKIERDGEDQKSIDEIIRLSKKYKFVTPYTSFLAVPRALLRPRVIRPGDPVLRIKTDAEIVSVLALFPFGLIQPLRYLQEEDTWQTRFLAPVDMADGTYQVRLLLRDRNNHVYREQKSFVIASKPPVLHVRLAQKHVHGGETLRVAATASGNARTISARLYGAEPVRLTWNGAAKANTGEIVVPRSLAPGRYTLNVTAEDVAHNIGSQEVPVEVW